MSHDDVLIRIDLTASMTYVVQLCGRAVSSVTSKEDQCVLHLLITWKRAGCSCGQQVASEDIEMPNQQNDKQQTPGRNQDQPNQDPKQNRGRDDQQDQQKQQGTPQQKPRDRDDA